MQSTLLSDYLKATDEELGLDTQILSRVDQKWRRIALSHQPTHHRIAQDAIEAVYRRLGRPAPLIWWFPSPEALYRYLVGTNPDALSPAKLAPVMGFHDRIVSVRPEIRIVYNRVLARLDALHQDMRNKVGEQIYQMGELVKSRVWNSGSTTVQKFFAESPFCMEFTQHDVAWLAAWDYMRRTTPDLEQTTPQLDPHFELARQALWVIPTATIAFAVEKPIVLHVDEDSMLHNLRGSAVQFPDGWTIDAVHGRPHTRLFHEDEYGGLYVTYESGQRRLLVRVLNSTPEPDGTFKEYFIPVPATVKTAREAVAWTFGLQEHEYEPVCQT